MLKIGDQAPDFILTNAEQELVFLKKYLGKPVVVLFFPFAFSPVCTKELCTMRDNLAAYNNLNVTVLAISVDSPFVLAKFKELNNLNFELLSDFNKEVMTAYDCMYREFAFGTRGVAKRSAFVVDQSGIIQYVEINDNPEQLPNFEAIQKILST